MATFHVQFSRSINWSFAVEADTEDEALFTACDIFQDDKLPENTHVTETEQIRHLDPRVDPEHPDFRKHVDFHSLPLGHQIDTYIREGPEQN